MCAECGWEDDGQDDEDAHIVRGGPNGALSLALARLEYLDDVLDDPSDESSVANGGDGMWRAAAQEARREYLRSGTYDDPQQMA
ncbi:hypothetical protein [Streptomyces sp. NPDC059881]|uniref:hypothetical protein n=1 Tax=Streptomyces sp. NPDC059881 TaxID=3346986 RepID=UPI003654DC8D